MSEGGKPPPRPLFEPRPSYEPEVPPLPGGSVNADLAAQMERLVMDVFSKRFGAQMMPYGQARVLATVERDVVEALVHALARQRS